MENSSHGGEEESEGTGVGPGRLLPSSPEAKHRGKHSRSNDVGTGRSYDAADAGDMHREQYYDEY